MQAVQMSWARHPAIVQSLVEDTLDNLARADEPADLLREYRTLDEGLRYMFPDGLPPLLSEDLRALRGALGPLVHRLVHDTVQCLLQPKELLAPLLADQTGIAMRVEQIGGALAQGRRIDADGLSELSLEVEGLACQKDFRGDLADQARLLATWLEQIESALRLGVNLRKASSQQPEL
jgi:hypothetical protein